MCTVERLVEYTKCKGEKEEGSNLSDWPSKGKIDYRDVTLRYSRNPEAMLKRISFTTSPAEKIGIIGRTGAGKSSIVYSLFRLYQADGAVLIDDVDTATVNLKHLRRNISIIPQEPVVFSGSLRDNLDPYREFTDVVLWKSLAEANLKQAVVDLDEPLDNRDNRFSIGQKQLVCLTRAVLRKNKILILDEAAANVDPDTNLTIQNVIRKRFAGSTVLIIAHRLNNVADCDKIIVVDSGSLVAFDKPEVLIKKTN